MKPALKPLFALLALTTALGATAGFALNGPKFSTGAAEGPTETPLHRVYSVDADDDDDSEGWWFGKQRSDDDDDCEEDDDDEDEGDGGEGNDDDDCTLNPKGMAKPNGDAPKNGLFGNGKAPQVKSN